MARLTRGQELAGGVTVLLLSTIGLVLVCVLLIGPEREHTERLTLALYEDATIVSSDTYMPDRVGYACDEPAPCCLQMVLFLTRASARPEQFTSHVSLPYGLATGSSPALSGRDACLLAVDFQQRFASRPVVFIDTHDDNSVYFNESTGASIAEYYQTWPGSNPAHPSLIVDVTRGDGVTIGAGFLLTVCCVLILLSSALLLLRLWDECHPVPGGASGSKEEAVRRSDFSKLQLDEDDEEAGGSQGASRRGGESAAHEISEFDGDIELEEQRLASIRRSASTSTAQQAHAGAADMETKYEEPASPSRSQVPRIQPPHSQQQQQQQQDAREDEKDPWDTSDAELAAFEREMLAESRQQ